MRQQKVKNVSFGIQSKIRGAQKGRQEGGECKINLKKHTWFYNVARYQTKLFGWPVLKSVNCWSQVWDKAISVNLISAVLWCTIWNEVVEWERPRYLDLRTKDCFTEKETSCKAHQFLWVGASPRLQLYNNKIKFSNKNYHLIHKIK